MKKVQERPNWTEARQLKGRKADLVDHKMFQGEFKAEKTEFQGANVVKLQAWPAGEEGPPESFAVSDPSEFRHQDLEDNGQEGVDQSVWYSWSAYEEESMPLDLRWSQADESRWRFTFSLPSDAKCFGLGERLSGVNLRGREHTLFAYSDALHIPSLDTMYMSVPFLVVKHQKRYYGVFLDSPAWQKWNLDMDLDETAKIDLLSRRGWTLFMFVAETLPDLLAAYTTLTGRSNLPPDWALGYHQSRWSYGNQETFLSVAEQIRESQIPCDCVVLDIDYMDEYRVFTHSKKRFPEFKESIDKLNAMNLKTTCILDPGVKKEERFSVYADGKKRDFFVRRGDGRSFIGKVWPGASVFPDFLRHDVRVWWAAQHGFFVDNNIQGVWNDMNEPCFLDKPCPLPPDSEQLPADKNQGFVQQAPEGKVGHFEVRNLYGFQMARASFEGLLALRPEERPFVLTRSGYSGVQRYSAVWLGDNMSWWEHLALSVPMLINVGLSGIPFCGVDVGGFGGDCSQELLIRWYELGIFYPFFRNHSSMEGAVQEPWVFGEEAENKIRHLVEMRYKLLPYLKRLFWEHVRNGAPILRPLFWAYPNDDNAYGIDDQFLFGNDIMVAPIVKRGHDSRVVYFPPGRWIPLENKNEIIAGGGYKLIKHELGKVPAYVREGTIIPTSSAIQSTAEYEEAQITFESFGDSAIGIYLEDDGTSFEYENDGYNEWLLRVENGEFKADCANYGYIAPDRTYLVDINGECSQVKLPK